MDELERIRESVDSLRKDFDSFLKSYNANNVGVQQGLTATSAWQDSHEKIDNERWERLGRDLAEMKAMVEAIPIELGKDLGKLEAANEAIRKELTEHHTAIERIKTVWLTISILASGALALAEVLLHLRKG